MKVNVPPIKSQGIKTKLVPWIADIIPSGFEGTWIEPFMGTGVVAFNLAPQKALLCDSNPHLINFYQAIATGEINAERVKKYLNDEGCKLLADGESHYYKVRERFNARHQPLDFLFLNRAGFNGMIRFNRKGGFNIPFCKKPNRFAQSYITKIVNQVDHVAKLLAIKEFTFCCQDFSKTVARTQPNDIIYCDPPYIGRHVDYYNSWDENHEKQLFDLLSTTSSQFILSTWHHNDFRKNEYIDLFWNQFNVFTREHFYHVGGSEKNRNPMIEAIIANFQPAVLKNKLSTPTVQLSIFEKQANYA